MTAKIHAETITLPSNSALAPYLRVKMSAGFLVAAGATDDELGVLEQRALAADNTAAVRMISGDVSIRCTAASAITQYATVYRAASGKIDDAVSGLPFGIALEAASGDGSVIEVLPYRQQFNGITGVAGGYKIARGTAAALDGSNPTPIATGLTTIVSAAVQLRGTAAPGDNTSVLTTDYTGSDGTLNVYAWKNTGGSDPTLVASTGTETFDWIAIGT
jgi:hypothetical protein